MKPAVLVPLIALALGGCNREPPPAVVRVAAQSAEQKANSSASASALAGESRVLQLAIPVEVSAAGVRVLGEGQVIRAPRPQPGSGPQLVVTLEGTSPESKFFRQYELPDPRLSEVEGRGQKVEPRARMYVYVELTDAASRIDVQPKPEGPPVLSKPMAFGESANSTIQISNVASKLCASGTYASSPLCRQVGAGK